MTGPVELDKPSKAPFDTSSYDDVRLHETSTGDGRTKAVLRDATGRLSYPNVIPPDTDTVLSAAKSGSSSFERPKKVNSDPVPAVNGANQTRPSSEGSRNIFTEAKGQRPAQTPAKPQRGSYVPAYPHPGLDDDDSSSNSSSSDVEVEGAAAKERRERHDDKFRRFRVTNDQYSTKGRVSKKDGRLNITVHDTSNTGYLAKALGTAAKKLVPTPAKRSATDGHVAASRQQSSTTVTNASTPRPRLNIVIMVIGSRGDAQPFIKIGKVLKEDCGHRVRIATHPAFRDFVEKDSGLEFFSVGGDPSELMAFMVKNPGMIPKLESVKAGDIGRRRAAMAEMFEGFWRACINATDDERGRAKSKGRKKGKKMGEKTPFVADAIIANPPSFAHVHCAEALGIPLHLMFTFPYTPTQAFPHPLATIKKSNVDPGYTNFMSYPLVEMMVWQGLGDLVNDFRLKTLGLDPVSTLWAPGSTYRLHVPYTYLWSPGLVPKPEDWGDEIDISGFTFLDLASTFEPPQDLVDFLGVGEAPIYIGFGSIVVDDADKFTAMIFEAVKQAGVRALISKGWGGFGNDQPPDGVFMLENTPHDWLFPRVKACVIHGGAGTTAIALKCGIPTMIVPFFGDQHFWGSMVSSAGAGPEPIPYKKLNAEKLAEGIKYCLTDEAKEAVGKIAKSIELEGDGAQNAVRSFHSHLPLSGQSSMRCSILPDRAAVWKIKETSLKLSGVAADILVEKGHLSWGKLRLTRHMEWNDFEGPGEPVTGLAGALVGTVGDFFAGFGSVPYRLGKTSNARAERKKKKAESRAKALERKRKAPKAKATSNGNDQGFPFPDPTAQGDKHQPDSRTGREDSQTPQADNASIATGATPGVGPLTAPAAEEYGDQVSKGFAQSGRAIAHAPVDIAMAIAQGFHNAPRLYGDDTVRRPPRVTGIKSGLKAARSEFIYGIYDGVTGIVRLPIKGGRERGFRGALAGCGMGLTGFVLKDIAAIVGPVGYTLKGITKQAERSRQPGRYIRRARIGLAQKELSELSLEERKQMCEKVYKGWEVMTLLSELIIRENGKKGILGRFETHGGRHWKKGQKLGDYGKGRAFESVEVAEQAIAALQRGDDVDEVLGYDHKNAGARKTADAKAMTKDTGEAAESVDSRAQGVAAKAFQEDVEAGAVPPQAPDTSAKVLSPAADSV